MSTITNRFSPSINIVRDSDVRFDYIVTPNAFGVFEQVFSNVLIGNKTHNIIGAYGSGKSSLLLAIKQTFSGINKHFKDCDTLLKQLPSFEFMSLVGDYTSLSKYLAQTIGIDTKNYSSSEVFKNLDNHYKQLQKKRKGLAIFIDEFGKFLEYASKHNSESEIYFIQQLAEWINDPKKDTVLITTLHQDFNTYALGLNNNQQQEWDKVKGRFNEVVFNEPVEQLLFLASKRLEEKFRDNPLNKNFDKLFDLIKKSKAFPLRIHLERDFAKKLFPFDALSAAVLTMALQRYGQNERSLFSFIESRDYYGIHDFESDKCYFSIAHVYDYLINNYYSYLTSQHNKQFSQWSNIRAYLEKLESSFSGEQYLSASALIKTIGLLNIFSSNAATLDFNFYCAYAKMSLGIKNPEDIIRDLEKHKVIRFQGYNSRYIFSETTDLDIQIEIDAAGRLIEKSANFLEHLNQHFDFPFISAKAAFYEKGTPRFFQFKLTSEPITLIPDGEIDGFINLIFNEDGKSVKKIEEFSRSCKEAILFGYYKNTSNVQNALFEIQKVKKVIKQNYTDKAAMKSLSEIEAHYIKLLNHYVLDSLYSNDGNIIWFYKGMRTKITDRQSFNKELSRISNEVYSATPIYKNELINKTKVSGQISKARNNLVAKLLKEIEKENLGFSEAEFPPEKTIYLSLLKETRIHNIENNVWGWQSPVKEDKKSSSFIAIWNAGEKFLESTKSKERNLQEFIDILMSKPFKLKQGLVDIWIPIFLLSKNDEYALYESGVYLPQLSEDIFELLSKKPGLFTIKAFDVAGVKLELFNRYRLLLNQPTSKNPTNKLFIQTIKPFLTFYKDLPEYAKKTTRVDKKAVALRKVIAEAKDPEKTFFDAFPTALGFSLSELQTSNKSSERFITQMQEAIRMLRTCYDDLVDRFEDYLVKDVFGFAKTDREYKSKIKERYKKIKAHLLLNTQRSFYERLLSPLDDRKAWLNSVAQSCVGKALSSISDDEEIVLFDKAKDLVYQLDNLNELSKADVDEEREDVIKVEITSFAYGSKANILRVKKDQNKEFDAKVKQVKSLLGKDKKMNITILTKLLEEELKNEQ
jgi:hypothetical protein